MKKFRAWDIKNKNYIEIIGFYYYDEHVVLWFLDSDGIPDYKSFHIKRIIIEQYTPLKTKKDDPVCQGDKIYIAGIGDCVVIFEGLTFEVITSKGDILELRDCIEDIEKIIGNIHEA